MEVILDIFGKSNQKERKTGRKEKSNVFTENLNESEYYVPLECLEEKHVIVDRLSGVSCVSRKCFSNFKFCQCDRLKMQKKRKMFS